MKKEYDLSKLKSYLAMKFIVLLVSFTISANSVSAPSEKWMLLGGIYYDNISKLNVKVGAALYINQENVKIKNKDRDLHSKYFHPSFIYSDYTKSENSDSIGIGWGKLDYATNYRLGVHYIRKEQERLIGVEGVLTLLFYSFKAGIYNSELGKEKFMIGVGFGW